MSIVRTIQKNYITQVIKEEEQMKKIWAKFLIIFVVCLMFSVGVNAATINFDNLSAGVQAGDVLAGSGVIFTTGNIPNIVAVNDIITLSQEEIESIITKGAKQEYERYKGIGGYASTFITEGNFSEDQFVSYVLSTAKYEHRLIDNGNIVGSRIDPNATNNNNNGSIDYGIMQINSSVGDVWFSNLDYKNDPLDNVLAGSRRIADLLNAAVALNGLEENHARDYAISGYNPGEDCNVRVTGVVSFIPIPAAVWLFCSGLAVIMGLGMRSRESIRC